MPIVGFRFRAYADRQTLRALKAQLKLACEVYNALRWARHAGREPPVVPVELRPLPAASATGKAGQGSGKPLKGGVAHSTHYCG